ncbi:MAG: ABC transporter ATP-binding protein [Thermodesulfobacteriota bacterium]|jgi:branched-chain amino acid transport system ATP-binding protein
MNNQDLLQVANVHVFYGKVESLRGVSFEVKGRSIVSVIGSNGAGKTTLLKAISGLAPIKEGTIKFNQKPLQGLPPHQITKLRIIHVPEGRQILCEMTVLENLEMGAYLEQDSQIIKERMQEVFQLFPVLENRLKQRGSTMSGGEQQMLAIGRAMMTDPELLMLDEPSLGLAPLIIKGVFRAIKQINDKGKTILLVEQSARIALKAAEYGFILENGKIALSGPTSDLIHQEQVRKIYLGGD